MQNFLMRLLLQKCLVLLIWIKSRHKLTNQIIKNIQQQYIWSGQNSYTKNHHFPVSVYYSIGSKWLIKHVYKSNCTSKHTQTAKHTSTHPQFQIKRYASLRNFFHGINKRRNFVDHFVPLNMNEKTTPKNLVNFITNFYWVKCIVVWA